MDISNSIMVFGSNEKGIHGAGAAKYALQNKGAIMYRGIGHHGNSYAIPTKDHHIRILSFEKIRAYIHNFICYAEIHPELTFQVTRIGTGLARYSDQEIAPLFKDAPDNCYFDTEWKEYLKPDAKYWGSF